jgi:hypothetical protein
VIFHGTHDGGTAAKTENLNFGADLYGLASGILRDCPSPLAMDEHQATHAPHDWLPDDTNLADHTF